MNAPPFLYAERSLEETARLRFDALAEAIAAAGESDVERLARRFAFEVPVLSLAELAIIERTPTATELVERGVVEQLPPGQAVTFAVPYSGDGQFFRVRPDTYAPHWLYATITPTAVHVTTVRADLDEAGLRAAIDDIVAELAAPLEHLREEVVPFNRALPDRIRELLARRAGAQTP